MNSNYVNIDFKALSLIFGAYIREKAAIAGSTIAYQKGNFLIEENPKTKETKILKDLSSSR